MKKTLTLVELIVAILLASFIILTASSLASYFQRKIVISIEEYRLRSEIYYALNSIELHCISATDIDEQSYFSKFGEEKKRFNFFGESDISNITPNDTSDNVWYHCYVDPDSKSLVLENTMTRKKEVLVEGRFTPEIKFKYEKGFEPNFLKATITGTVKVGNISKKVSESTGIRFWFIGVRR